MRKFAVLMGFLLLVSMGASAQDHSKVDVFGGYSYLRFSPGNGAKDINFNGGVGSVSFNPSNWIGFVGEIGGYHSGSVYGSGVSVNTVSYLFGPKIFMSGGKIEPFAQVLFGGVHGTCSKCGGAPGENAFAMALGAGLDWNAHEHLAVRLGQIEYAMTRFSSTGSFGSASRQNNFRYSAGVVFRF